MANKGAAAADASSISVKLSALHPRYEPARSERMLAELTPRVLELAQRAADLDVPLTIDAEEAERLELSLAVVRAVMEAPQLHAWRGFGLAVQAYQRRAPAVLAWLIELATRQQRPLNNPPREGRVLGQRGQARAGAWPRGLSGVHAQGEYRRGVAGLRAPADRSGCGADPSAIRHAQCAPRWHGC